MNLKDKLTGLACVPFAVAMLSACASDDADNQGETNWGGKD